MGVLKMGKSIYDLKDIKFENMLMVLHEMSVSKLKKEQLMVKIDESLIKEDRESFIEYSKEFKELSDRILELEKELKRG